MTTYIAFLRGINVGGHNRMSMDRLRELCVSLGYDNVGTYIQSGNVVFETAKRQPPAITAELEGAIDDAFGYDISVMVLTRDQLAAVADRQPFEKPDDDATRRYVAFLGDPPDDGGLERLRAAANTAEDFSVDGNVVYSRLDTDAMGGGRFTDVGAVLGVPATRRAWNVVERVLELASSSDQ